MSKGSNVKGSLLLLVLSYIFFFVGNGIVSLTHPDAAEEVSEEGDEGTNDLLISDVIRTNETQAWFLYEHLVNIPLVKQDIL